MVTKTFTKTLPLRSKLFPPQRSPLHFLVLPNFRVYRCCSRVPIRHLKYPILDSWLIFTSRFLSPTTTNEIEMGSVQATYSVPQETKKLFIDGILNNPLISKSVPPETIEYGSKVKFVGSDAPSIPINWRFAESIASLKGFEATMLNVLLVKKYGIEPQEVIINT